MKMLLTPTIGHEQYKEFDMTKKLPQMTPEILENYKKYFVPGKEVCFYIFDEFDTWLFGSIVEWKDEKIKIKFRDNKRHHRCYFDFPEFEVPIEYLGTYIQGV